MLGAGRALALCAVVAACDPAGAAERIALVVGNSHYEKAPSLRNPANDAQDVATSLKELGFTLIGGGAQLNVDRPTLARLVRDFGNAGHDGDTALFYYAGHGIAYNGDNWLLPVNDGEIQVQDDVPDFALSARSVVERMQQRGGGVNILILDACRNNPLPDRKRSVGGTRGLVRLNVPVGSFILYAASQGQAAMDGDGRNGLFTGVLLPLLKEPGLRLEDIYYRTLKKVAAVSQSQQEPMAELKLTEPFYFQPASVAPADVLVSNAPSGGPAAGYREDQVLYRHKVAGNPRIAFVRGAELVRGGPLIDWANATLHKQFGNEQAELAKARDQLNADREALKTAGEGADAAKHDRAERALQAREQELETRQHNLDQRYEAKRRELWSRIFPRISHAVEEVALQGGFDLVVQGATVGTDVTDRITALLKQEQPP